MQKYLAIVDFRTALLLIFCAAITWLCLALGFSYDLNVTLFSIAVVFPLVFTIREAFKRRDDALEFLSQFKSSTLSVHYAFEQAPKLTRPQKDWARKELRRLCDAFLKALSSNGMSNAEAETIANGFVAFIRDHRSQLSNSGALKIIRFMQDVHESMEKTIGLKVHGTPISLRAYCLVFVFIFPVVFTPTIVYHLVDKPAWITYTLSLLHGFILITLYNVQADMENPFDQIGLDDVKLEDYHFLELPLPAIGLESEAEPEAEPEAAPKPEPEAAPRPEPEAAPRPEPEAPKPEPDQQLEPDPAREQEPKTEREPEPEAAPGPVRAPGSAPGGNAIAAVDTGATPGQAGLDGSTPPR
ncbi:MAG: hypothetical protein ABR612_03210 [Chromatocurvus sp.]